jgi:phosphoesterase RecJ-like protein
MADPAEIGRLIANHERFVVISHHRPDGDAIGSQLAFGESLRAIGKTVFNINRDGVPENLAFLDPEKRIQQPSEVDADAIATAEVIFVLDTATRERIGTEVIALLPEAASWVVIDHHVSNHGYGDVNLINPVAPATGEILFDLIRHLDLPLTPTGRDALYAAISTDTGSFKYPATTSHTLEVASELVAEGTDVGLLSEALYASYPLRRIHLLRELLSTLQLEDDGRIASWVLTREARERIGTHPHDAEGLIDELRSIASVDLAVFFEAGRDDKVRLSARSKSGGPDVSQLCSHFGGGGHPRAAGACLDGPIEAARNQFIEHAIKTNHANT